MTRSLQALLEEQLEELPRRIAEQLVRDKLADAGIADNQAVVDALVTQIMSGAGDGMFDLDVDVPEGTLPGTISVEFDDEDLAYIGRAADAFQKELPGLVETMARQAADAMVAGYRKSWPEWHAADAAVTAEFRGNIELRWGKGFDLLRMLIEISRDQGMAFDRRAQRSRSNRHAHLNTALVHLHARALQIASEIMVLMESGYADGAMARWRTLHEVTCVAMVLADGGDALARRYLEHDAVESKKALG